MRASSNLIPTLRSCVILFALARVICTPLIASESVLKKEVTDSWVETFETDIGAQSPNAGNQSDLYYLLVDRQKHAEEKARFIHYSYRLLTESGVQENSQLSVSFDPAYETLTFHRLRIIRDSKTIDRLQGQKIEVLRRETGADRQVYDGRLSAMIVLDDIRVGDVIEYSYSIRGSNPVFDDHFSTDEATRWSSPVHQLRLRIHWSKDRRVQMRNHGSPKAMEIVTENGMRLAKLDEDHLPAVLSDGDLPGFHSPFAWIEFSDYPDWGAVAKWALRQFPRDQTLPPTAKEEVERLRSLPSEESRILGALRWVQDSIRYLGNFNGIHSHRPFPLDLVVSRRFGDCKDKANLLSTMLRDLGIQCRVGLVSTQSRKAISDWLPSPSAFDHAIVGIESAEGVQWLDATSSYQRGPLQSIYLPDYVWALPVGVESRRLMAIEPTGHDRTSLHVTEKFVFKDYTGSAQFTVTSVYTGNRADSQRAYFKSRSQDEIERDYLNFYAEDFAKISARERLRFTDDEKSNTVTVHEAYELKDVWQKSNSNAEQIEFAVSARILKGEFFEPSTRIRKMPFHLSHPRACIQVLRFEFPTRLELNNAYSVVTNPAFDFSIREESTDTSTEVTYHYKSRLNHVTAAQTAKYLADIKAAQDQSSYFFALPASYQVKSIEEIASSNVVTTAENARPVWILVIVSMVSFIASTLFCVVVYSWDPESRKSANSSFYGVSGISGWLLMVSLGVVLSPLFFAWSWYASIQDINADDWAALTQKGSTSYHTLWEPVVVLDLVWLAASLPFSLLFVVLFFKHRTSYPLLQGVDWILIILLCSARAWVYDVLPNVDKAIVSENSTNLIRNVIHALIWIPYLVVSDRVRNTFIRRRGTGSHSTPSAPPPLPPAGNARIYYPPSP